MRERAINMHETEVLAILEGRKTQFRRIIQPQPFMVLSAAEWHSRAMSGVDPYGCRPVGSHVLEEMVTTCPFGAIGSRLWVREAWTRDHEAFYPHFPIVYRADRGYDYERNERGEVYSPEQKAWYPYRWRSSMHMPRWASRITLEVSGLRVERLQDITHRDAIAEGIPKGNWSDGDRDPCVMMDDPRDDFMELWQSISGPESWDMNPWVWVIEFKVV